MRQPLALGLIILFAGALLGFGGGWWVKGLTITPHADTVRVEVPIKPSESTLDTSAQVIPKIRYIRWEDSTKIDSLTRVILSLLQDTHDAGGTIVASLDTILTRHELQGDSLIALADSFHVEYHYPPVSRFMNISLRHSPYEVRRDTVLQWDEVTGFQLFRDGKYIVLGAAGTLAVIKLIEIIKN